MKSFRNYNKRGRFRNNDRGYKRNGESPRLVNDFSVNSGFRRNTQGRNNNYNAAKLIGKYTGLAREALSSGDKILSENYFQHADHFTRILSEQENTSSSKIKENKIEVISDNIKKNEQPETIDEKKDGQPETTDT